MKSLLVPAVLLLLATPPVACAEDEPVQVDRLALEGRWSDARAAWRAWREPQALGRLDVRGFEVELWRTAWDIGADGRATSREDGTEADIRRAGHRLVARGEDPLKGSPGTFRLLEALYAERLLRETRGMGDLPTGSPLAALPDPDGLVARFLAWQAEVYRPTPAEQSTDAAWAAQARAAREQAESLRSSAHLWAGLAAAILLLLTALAGWCGGRTQAKPASPDVQGGR